MFNRKNKKFINTESTIDFSSYTFSNYKEPIRREYELLKSYGDKGYELVSVVIIPKKFNDY